MTNTTLNYVTPNPNKLYTEKTIFRLAITIVTILLALLLFFGMAGYADTHYNTIASVLEVGEDYTLFVDGAGYVWEVTDTCYRKGQFVDIKFFNNTTDYTRNDDKIINVKILDD